MKMKRILALLLTGTMIFALASCGAKKSAPKDKPEAKASDKQDKETENAALKGYGDFIDPIKGWDKYNEILRAIKSEKDVEKRTKMEHDAESMVMNTGAIVPLWYGTKGYLASTDLKNYHSTVYGINYFTEATLGDKKSLSVNFGAEPERLDPQLNSAVDGANLAVMAFTGLYTYDKDNQAVPALAKDTKISDDKLTYTITLRDGLKFSDGSKLDAKDFEYSLKRLADPMTGADYGFILDCVDGYPDKLNVKASDDGKTLTIKLKYPTPYFLNILAQPCASPVKKEFVEAAPGFKKDGKIADPGAWATKVKFVCNGPFILEKWDHNQSMTYKKNPNYYQADKVKLEEINAMLSAEATTTYNAFLSGSIQFTGQIPSEEMENAKKSKDFRTGPSLSTSYQIFNVASPIFKGKTPEQAAAMRKAFYYLIDRGYIIDTIIKLPMKPANSIVGYGVLGSNSKEFKKNSDLFTYPVNDGYYELDGAHVDKAKELLEFAGFKFDGDKLSASTPLNIVYKTNPDGMNKKVAEAIQNDLAEIGINMTIKTSEWKVFLKERKAGNFDVARGGWIFDFNNPINILDIFSSEPGNGNNDSQFGGKNGGGAH